jgi:hypothetical protein
MQEYTTIPGYAIVEILKDDHDRKFYKDITLASGATMKLSLAMPESGLYDEHYEQGVSIARIVAVGDGIAWIKPGDEVVVDYSVDTDGGKVISNIGGKKLVRCEARNEFYTESKRMSASKFAKFEVNEYNKGDLKNASTIFGVIKGNEIIPNFPYVFMNYVDFEGEFDRSDSGLIIPSTAGELVIRQVLFSHPDSPMQPGDMVVVDYASLYEREISGDVVSICMHGDIIGKLP